MNLLGEYHEDVADTLQCMGYVYCVQEFHDHALDCFTQAFTIRHKLLDNSSDNMEHIDPLLDLASFRDYAAIMEMTTKQSIKQSNKKLHINFTHDYRTVCVLIQRSGPMLAHL